jgi:glycosyltransferase involved in cell wall biosynthesis
MANISLVIIAYNEQDNILRCIRSAREVVDEVVVVDSFSTDKTKERCLAEGVRFIEHPFEGYTAQKNVATSLATHNLILSLDADEALSDTLRQEIAHIKANLQAPAYEMNRLTNYCGHWIRHTDWYPDRKIRLFDRTQACWTGQNLHETVALNSPGQVVWLKGDILHYSYHSIGQHIAQFNRFTDIGAQEAFEKGKKASLLKILLNPVWKFFQSYMLRLGFLDGYYGLLVCAISAFATFAKYIKLRELHQHQKVRQKLDQP